MRNDGVVLEQVDVAECANVDAVMVRIVRVEIMQERKDIMLPNTKVLIGGSASRLAFERQVRRGPQAVEGELCKEGQSPGRI